MEGPVVIEGLDIFDVATFIAKKNKKFQFLALTDIEQILGKDDPNFPMIRKIFLDTMNDYTRSIMRVVFDNEIEPEVYHN